ncbi:MAG: response regulator [Anaerolineales bacterium]|nr:response regulator [Anaerolineales bacterium]
MNTPVALIIEDDPKLGKVYEAVVQQNGYLSEVIQLGNEALRILASFSPALILLDLHLPYVSGDEILHYIRTNAHLASIPVIILTADVLMAKKLEDLGECVVIKSYGISKLRQLIASVPKNMQSALGSI